MRHSGRNGVTPGLIDVTPGLIGVTPGLIDVTPGLIDVTPGLTRGPFALCCQGKWIPGQARNDG